MVFVAVGWQVYEIDRNPFHLGLVGLAEFLPLLLFALPAGRSPIGSRASWSTSPRWSSTRRSPRCCWSSASPVQARSGRSSLSRSPAAPRPRSETRPSALCGRRSCRSRLLTRALALRSTVFQATVVTGPALGGLLFALRPEAVYGTGVALMLTAALLAASIRTRAIEQGPVEIVGTRLGSLLAGLALRPADAGAARCDLTRPRRGPVRWGGRAPAALRARHPRRRGGGARSAAERAGGRRVARRGHADQTATAGSGGAKAPDRRRRSSARAWSCSVSRIRSRSRSRHSP